MRLREHLMPGLATVIIVFVVTGWQTPAAQPVNPGDLDEGALTEEQKDLLYDIEVEVDSTPVESLDPSTKPEGFDELDAALKEIDQALSDLQRTTERLPEKAGGATPSRPETRLGAASREEAAQPSSGETPPASTRAEREPNDVFGTATPISSGGEISGTIQPRGDADWFVLESPEQGQLAVRTASVPAEIDLVVRVWNADKGTISGWYAPLRAGGQTEAIVDLRERGKYYLEVRDGRDDTAVPERYRFAVEFTRTGDALEPNDTFGTAAAIALGSLEATILPRGDVDWYGLEVDDQGELTVTIERVPENLAIVLRAWNANKDTITGWFAPLAKGGPTEALIDLPAAGRYYLELHDDRDDARSVERYAMSLEFAPTRDAAEPNNSFGKAVTLALDQPTQATILPRGDADWYVVTAERQGELTVEITNSPPDLDMTFRVWNQNKDTVSGWMAPLRKGGDAVGKVSLPDPGDYYIEVRDGRDDARSIERYTLTVSLR